MRNRNIKVSTLTFFIPIIFAFVIVSTGWCDVYYMPGDFDNLHDAFAGMSSGDELVIKDGIYTGSNNIINDSHFPPNGTSMKYTTVRAENNGRVTFDGEEKNNMFIVYGGGNQRYFQFEGIKWIRPQSGDAAINLNADYFKFFRCGAMKTDQGGASTWYLSHCSYYLLEECYSWGNGRYGISNYHSNHGILRRCVVRQDAASGGGRPIAGTQNYASSNMEYQNCIVLDIDSSFFNDHSYDLGGMAVRQSDNEYYSDDVNLRGCIILNLNGPYGGERENNIPTAGISVGHDNHDGHPITISNCISWDVSRGLNFGSDSGNGDVIIDHCTFFVRDHPLDKGDGINGYSHDDGSISNCLIINADRGAVRNYGGDLINNLFYNNSENCQGSANCPGTDYYTTIDPMWSATNLKGGIKYINRINDDSNLSEKDALGGKIGGTVENKIGVSGSLYGEDGYNSETSESLWPFPYEAQIRSDMRAYTPDGGPSGSRGFCADGQTLTKYIWEYLGNQIPEIIYNKINWDANLRIICRSCRVCGHEYGKLLETCPLCGAKCND